MPKTFQKQFEGPLKGKINKKPGRHKENIGIKDMLRAPSAIILLKIFGNFKAMKKESAIVPAPKVAAIRISLINPSNRLISVIPETRNNGLIIFIN